MIKTYRKKIDFLKIDDNKILNLNCIKWVKKIDECMEICTKGDGCYVGDTHKLCRANNPESYDKLNRQFDSP